MMRSRPAARHALAQQRRCFGALTSKPYAFTARPWELRGTDSVDVSDGLGANILVQSKVGEVMRVVPRENDEVNEEWIHDKARFSYDGLKRQRLTRPLVRSAGDPSRWDETSSTWRGAFARVKAALDKQKQSKGTVRAICGASVDIYSALALADWANAYADVELESLSSSGGVLGGDVASMYRFNSGILGLEQADYVLAVGTDIYTEAPLLMMRLRSMFLHATVEVETIGVPSDLTFPVSCLGLTPAALGEVASGAHPSSAKLAAAQRPAIIVSASALERHDGAAIQLALEQIAHNVPALRQLDPKSGKALWNGLNVLHHSANDVGLLDLGRSRPFDASADRAPADVLYLLGVSEEDLPVPASQLIGPNTFTIVQHSHGDALTSRADVVLPGAAFTEKNGVYTNFEGRAQVARNAITPPADARVDWKIVRAMSEATGGPRLPYDSEKQLRDRAASLAPALDRRGQLAPAMLPEQLLGADLKQLVAERARGVELARTPFRPTVHDFFLDGNAVARASPTMAKASVEHGPDSNFLPMNE